MAQRAGGHVPASLAAADLRQSECWCSAEEPPFTSVYKVLHDSREIAIYEELVGWGGGGRRENECVTVQPPGQHLGSEGEVKDKRRALGMKEVSCPSSECIKSG